MIFPRFECLVYVLDIDLSLLLNISTTFKKINFAILTTKYLLFQKKTFNFRMWEFLNQSDIHVKYI